jgi:hypothetical protein
MKQSFARIVAWARKHPWLAAAIIGGVLVLGYVTYKRFGGTGGTSGGDKTQELPAAIEAPALGTASGGAADFPVPVTSGGLTTTPTQPQTTNVPSLSTPSPSLQSGFDVPSFSAAYNSLGVQDSSSFASSAVGDSKKPLRSIASPRAGVPVSAAEEKIRAATGRSTGRAAAVAPKGAGITVSAVEEKTRAATGRSTGRAATVVPAKPITGKYSRPSNTYSAPRTTAAATRKPIGTYVPGFGTIMAYSSSGIPIYKGTVRGGR